MTKKRQPRVEDNLNTSNEFIGHAAKTGASVKRGKEYTKIKMHGQGSVSIKPSNEQLEPEDKRNYVKWFKLLGLLSIIIGGLSWFFSNYHIIW